MTITLTADQIHQIDPYTPISRAQTYIDGINQAMVQFGITEWSDVCMFIAQILEESGGLNYTTELASGQAYEGRRDLGNTQPGDGVKYKGRGLIQCTGRALYQLLSQALGVDFINHPELLATSPYCCLSAGWYWKYRNISSLTGPNNESAFEAVTRRINGGLNGLEMRQQFWRKAQQVIPQPKPAANPAPEPVQVAPTPDAAQTPAQTAPSLPESPGPQSLVQKITSWF